MEVKLFLNGTNRISFFYKPSEVLAINRNTLSNIHTVCYNIFLEYKVYLVMNFPHFNSYLSGDRQSEIFRDARSNLCFKHGTVSFQEYKKNHCYTEWVGRKFTALPKAFWHGVIKTIYHLACVIFYGIPTAAGYKGAYIHIYFSYVARDLQASFGSLATLCSDRYGQFHVIDSKFQARCYEVFTFSEWQQTKRKPDKPHTSASPQPPRDRDPIHNSYTKYPFNQSSGSNPSFFSQSSPFEFNFHPFDCENLCPSDPQRETHYSILGLLENASPREIKSAYHKLAKQYHPDRVSKLPVNDYEKRLQESTNRFLKIDKAYKALI